RERIRWGNALWSIAAGPLEIEDPTSWDQIGAAFGDCYRANYSDSLRLYSDLDSALEGLRQSMENIGSTHAALAHHTRRLYGPAPTENPGDAIRDYLVSEQKMPYLLAVQALDEELVGLVRGMHPADRRLPRGPQSRLIVRRNPPSVTLDGIP